jgi:hypothetical protein
MSCNYHLSHFGETAGIRTSGGDVAHSACVAFGMERLALALLWAHGSDPATWPDGVREALALEGPARA